MNQRRQSDAFGLDAVRDVVEDLAQAVIQGGEAVTPSTFLFGCLTLLGCGVLLGDLLGLRDVCEHGRDESALLFTHLQFSRCGVQGCAGFEGFLRFEQNEISIEKNIENARNPAQPCAEQSHQTSLTRRETEIDHSLSFLALRKTALIELLRESDFGNDLVSAVLGPRRIVLICASSAAPHSRANTALLIEPLGDQVHVGLVLIHLAHDVGWEVEPYTLPLKATANQPVQHPRIFIAELFGQHPVSLLRGDRYEEGDQHDPAPDSVIVTTDNGSMISREPQFEFRDEVERLAVQNTRGHGVTPGHLLNPRFVKALPVFGFDHRDHAHACEPCKLRSRATRVRVALCHDDFGLRLQPVTAHDFPQRIDYRALAVRTYAVSEEENLFPESVLSSARTRSASPSA